jgi:hypothetical protein
MVSVLKKDLGSRRSAWLLSGALALAWAGCGGESGAGDAGHDSGGACAIAASDCTDGPACTVPSCPAGVCEYVPQHDRCPADEAGCTMAACDPELGCVSVPNTSDTGLLWDNGSMVNMPGAGPGGTDLSVVQTDLGMALRAFNLAGAARAADDFEVEGPEHFHVMSIVLFVYQPNDGTTSTIDHVNYRIWDGPPDEAESEVVYGDTETNRYLTSSFSNIYRVRGDELDPLDTSRPIMRVIASADVVLPPGTYWLDWEAGGTVASGPWQPPVTINGETTTGNALRFQDGEWAPLIDYRSTQDDGTMDPQGLPFLLRGPCVTPEPA